MMQTTSQILHTATDHLTHWPCLALSEALGLSDMATSTGLLPPFWHQLYFREAMHERETGPDGHRERGGFLPDVPGLQRMWAGSDIRFHAPLRMGQDVERETHIAAINEKQGRSGRLVFVDVHHALKQEDRLCWSDTHHIVYREPVTKLQDAFKGQQCTRTADVRIPWHAREVQLFRYSALTYNGHRIHYDRDYCRDVEGYPDIVVHGPLLATLMLEASHRLVDRDKLTSFAFKARAPVFSHEAFHLCACRSGDGQVDLWVEDDASRLRVEGHACFAT